MLAMSTPSVFVSCRSVSGQFGIDGDYGLSVDGHNHHYYDSKEEKHKKPKKNKKKHHHDEQAANHDALEVPV